MTEHEWLTATSVLQLLTANQLVTTPRRTQLFGKDVVIEETIRTPLFSFTPRKIRLFGVACCWRTSPRLPPFFLDLLLAVEQQVDSMKSMVELAALHIKGSEEEEQLRAAERDIYRPGVFSAAEAVVFTADPDVEPVTFAVNLSNNLACSAGELARKEEEENRWPPEVEAATDAESASHCAVFRDIFGNPFRPITLNSSWLTLTVTNLATIAYEKRALPSGELDTARLAILADALEDAGCDNHDILSHLRSSGPHVRGCHVLDKLLGKE